jgi:hypothetical protein
MLIQTKEEKKNSLHLHIKLIFHKSVDATQKIGWVIEIAIIFIYHFIIQ